MSGYKAAGLEKRAKLSSPGPCLPSSVPQPPFWGFPGPSSSSTHRKGPSEPPSEQARRLGRGGVCRDERSPEMEEGRDPSTSLWAMVEAGKGTTVTRVSPPGPRPALPQVPQSCRPPRPTPSSAPSPTWARAQLCPEPQGPVGPPGPRPALPRAPPGPTPSCALSPAQACAQLCPEP